MQTEELEGRVAQLLCQLRHNEAELQNLRDEAGSQAAELDSLRSHRASLTSALHSARRDLQASPLYPLHFAPWLYFAPCYTLSPTASSAGACHTFSLPQ